MAIATGGAGRGRDAGARADGRGDVFPGLEAFFWSGILVGLLPAVVVAGLRGRFDAGMLNLAGMGAGLGAILGLFVGLARGVWRPGQPLPVRDPEPTSPVGPEAGWTRRPSSGTPGWTTAATSSRAEPEVVAEEPAVRGGARGPDPGARRGPAPRDLAGDRRGDPAGGRDRADDPGRPGRAGRDPRRTGLGQDHRACGTWPPSCPPGPAAGSGCSRCSTSRAIAAAGPDPLVILTLDSHQVARPGLCECRCMGYTDHELAALDTWSPPADPAIYRLAPWDQDDAIEYLLATDRDACASVMGRLGRSGDFAFLDGIPELCTVVLDRMARDESIGDVRTALRARAGGADRRARPIPRERIEDLCLRRVRRNGAAGAGPPWPRSWTGGEAAGEHLARLIRHRPAALLLAADRIAAIIECGQLDAVLADRLPARAGARSRAADRGEHRGDPASERVDQGQPRRHPPPRRQPAPRRDARLAARSGLPAAPGGCRSRRGRLARAGPRGGQPAAAPNCERPT